MPLDHFDVLIVGAGLSGIGAACHLQADCPGKSYAILEARGAMGGTWDLFRYPGIRSDSDMFTLGYRFRPWREAKAIADGPAILNYIRETARDRGVESRIRYHHRVVRAAWSTEQERWTVEAERTDTGETVRLTCGFLFCNTGYYRYDEGYAPRFEGMDRFGGELVHPQHWPEQLDCTGKRVIVIGSGATAVTLVPALAERAAHVTMLQRSPSYVLSLPARDPLASALGKVLPARALYPLVRWKNVLLTSAVFQLSRRAPRFMKGVIRKGIERQLGPEYPIDPHFQPTYDPWDQRLCLVPDGDLFTAIRRGDATIVTDGIETFTEKGVRLTSGDELEADVIVTATGLNLLILGGMTLSVDGSEVDLAQTVAYKGTMLSGVPNLAVTIGYTNASWTLKADLVARYVCRLLNHMDRHGHRVCTPHAPDPAQSTEPFIDLKSGYVLRSVEALPRQGARAPWRLHQNYPRDVVMLGRRPIDDEGVAFSGARAGAPAAISDA